MQLKLDSSGNVVLNPVTGWITSTAAGIDVLLALQYLANPADIDTGQRQQIQFVLTAPQCLELAERLTTLAQKVLANPGTPPN